MQRERHCIICGTDITDKRSDAKTCGDVCRKRLQRFKDQIDSQSRVTLDAIYYVASCANDSLFAGLAAEWLEYILNYVKGLHADVVMGQPPRQWWTDADAQ